jgi:hypothetical protein
VRGGSGSAAGDDEIDLPRVVVDRHGGADHEVVCAERAAARAGDDADGEVARRQVAVTLPRYDPVATVAWFWITV